jgi:transketolase
MIMSSRLQRANAIRALAMDAVQKANSGHPGMPMGMADIAEVLWHDHLRHNPQNPDWWNRDRFILSNGHGSMLLYALLHLTGYDVSIEDLKNFRQLHSKTPGHPEYGYTPGVETTTGPLGQGISNAVGMALAEKMLAAHFNRPHFNIIDHYTYVFLGDGCLMEGISHEACSLAGTWKLGKLIAFWDDNGISIDGEVAPWFSDDTARRFESYHWHVVRDVDGHDPLAIEKALLTAKAVTDRPSLICCKTTIGFGAPNLAGTAKTHGSPLGDAEIANTRKNLAWVHEPFILPQEITNSWSALEKGQLLESKWQTQWNVYQQNYPELATELTRRLAGDLPSNWITHTQALLEKHLTKAERVATRKASLYCLNHLAPLLPELLGGSADLTGSNLTQWQGSVSLVPDKLNANYIHYGVREFGMSAIMNGIALYGGFIPFAGTFLTFSDYARNAVRMAALMKQRVIFVYSHDSIGLGEDGPTHQSIEHVASLRLIPNLYVWRPCDAVETAIAWQASLEKKTAPSCLLLTRQDLPPQVQTQDQIQAISKGAYILRDCEGIPDLIIIATGSEVHLATQAAEQLNSLKIRVVSMPCSRVFDEQSAEYRETILPKAVKKRVAIEAGVSDGWYRYVGLDGLIFGIDRFGESAPAEELFKFFGLTVENIVEKIKILNLG